MEREESCPPTLARLLARVHEASGRFVDGATDNVRQPVAGRATLLRDGGCVTLPRWRDASAVHPKPLSLYGHHRHGR